MKLVKFGKRFVNPDCLAFIDEYYWLDSISGKTELRSELVTIAGHRFTVEATPQEVVDTLHYLYLMDKLNVPSTPVTKYDGTYWNGEVKDSCG